jgi:hypothetical protein
MSKKVIIIMTEPEPHKSGFLRRSEKDAILQKGLPGIEDHEIHAVQIGYSDVSNGIIDSYEKYRENQKLPECGIISGEEKLVNFNEEVTTQEIMATIYSMFNRLQPNNNCLAVARPEIVKRLLKQAALGNSKVPEPWSIIKIIEKKQGVLEFHRVNQNA